MMQIMRALDSEGRALSDIDIAEDKPALEQAYNDQTSRPDDPAASMKSLLFGCDVTLANGHKYKVKPS